ncbi:Nucleotide-binding universal stress protein, UspA family [Salinimicrobium catena]|uniref:Nucleotide-binding universal stress protein, UspA family n=1 Tax=Salinimicrobium catena TaxID=390640 RepID=A0A1H5N335_9FLAO|nr:universal stress protein [Salinimicrobium catena]SDL35550.1 Nucleotide-binding universal stress protein, UspA family [Salinimicrobium catena]SEE95953.1 Nucleotide-binding universal stress protein, UspA family [Salinimicrobium catena]
MKKIKNILVALDLSHLDEKLISYASFIAERLKAENVYFVHNIKKYEISELFEEHLKDVNLDEVIGDELNEKVKEHFKAPANWEVLISEDPYSESLIKYIAEKYSIDLAILGNKKHEKGTGVVSGKLLRLLRCDILAVPGAARESIKNIWAGTDFSQDSRKVFRVTKDLQEGHQVDLKVVHVYSVPVQFSPYVSPESMGPKVEKHVKEKFDKFLKKLNYSEAIEPLIFMGRESGAAQKIIANLRNSEVDMLVISDKGGNTFSPFAVGTVTEELFNANLDVPLWVVK